MANNSAQGALQSQREEIALLRAENERLRAAYSELSQHCLRLNDEAFNGRLEIEQLKNRLGEQ